jgi:hypothetical protein
VRRRVGRQLGDVQRSPFVGERGRGKDGCGNAEPLQDVERAGDARVGIVERHVQQAPAAVYGLRGVRGPETPPQEVPDLALELTRPDGEDVRPVVGDGVVAEDERP